MAAISKHHGGDQLNKKIVIEQWHKIFYNKGITLAYMCDRVCTGYEQY